MSTTIETISPASQLSGSRIASIDILRGLTMVVMIFVNDLASVQGLPWWTYHAPRDLDAMTYVDMVFPLFLFMVGMSIPLAVKQRLKKNPSTLGLWKHILLRSLSLLILGLILANAAKGDPARMGISKGLWALLALGGGILVWSVYPGSKSRASLLRLLGLVLIAAMFAIFRRTAHGHPAWIDISYPEILGLIGYTYLSVCILYIPTRRWRWAPAAWFVALTTLCGVYTAHHLMFLRHVPLYLWPFGNGAMPSITMAGILTSSIFLGSGQARPPQWKMVMATLLGVLMLAAGWFLTPLGISKIRATPTWCLYSIAAGILLFTALYWLCDIKKQTRWAFFAHSAGSNTLLTYLLPDLYYFATATLGFLYLEKRFSYGWLGVVRSILFTAFILAISSLLTKWRLRMQL
jgi:heparan-alpha-glucosaminide N-acetyltransferase